MQTLLTEPRQAIVPAPRVPRPAPNPAPASAALNLTQGVAEDPALLRATLSELLAEGIRTLEVDVSAVPVLRAAALRALLDVDTTLRRRGGRVRLLNATPRSIRVMAASRALHVTDIAGS